MEFLFDGFANAFAPANLIALVIGMANRLPQEATGDSVLLRDKQSEDAD